MNRKPLNIYNFPKFDDQDIINSYNWFMSFISPADWLKRKTEIEMLLTYEIKSQPPLEPLTKGTLLAIKKDVIGWYLYLIHVLIHEPQKYEYFQGARVMPIFKRMGEDLKLLKSITGIEKRVRKLLKKRTAEADALLFEFLVALLWKKNGYEVSFLEEKKVGKTPDLMAEKNGEIWHIECKRQSKTSEYTYAETAKRQTMLSHINLDLLQRNLLLNITFHVELKSLPDTYLKDLLSGKLDGISSGHKISNEQVTIVFSYVDLLAANKHLAKYSVKNTSPQMNILIGGKAVDNLAFSCGTKALHFRLGDGEINNLYVDKIANEFGVFWTCDAEAAIHAKARDIIRQVHSAAQQFQSDEYGYKSVVHIGMETFDGPAVERARLKKIQSSTESINPADHKLSWIFCHFFQSYSTTTEDWVFDETVLSLTPYVHPIPPINRRLLVVPEDGDTSDDIVHWERPLPE